MKKKWEVIATKSICNTACIQILQIDDNVVKFRMVTNDRVFPVITSHIRYDYKGHPYFIAWKEKEYLSEYMRV